MFRKLRDFWSEWGVSLVFLLLVVALVVGLIWYESRPATYDFGNGARLVVPSGIISIDQRKDGYGIVVASGANVTVYNDSSEWRSLTVSSRKPNYSILDTHAFEDLPPKSSKTFGVDAARYEGMHVSVSDFAQKQRERETK